MSLPLYLYQLQNLRQSIGFDGNSTDNSTVVPGDGIYHDPRGFAGETTLGMAIAEAILEWATVVAHIIMFVVIFVMTIGRLKLAKWSLRKQTSLHMLNFSMLLLLVVTGVHSFIIALVVHWVTTIQTMVYAYALNMFTYFLSMAIFVYIWLKAAHAFAFLVKTSSSDMRRNKLASKLWKAFELFCKIVIVLTPFAAAVLSILWFTMFQLLFAGKLDPFQQHLSISIIFGILGLFMVFLTFLVGGLGLQILYAYSYAVKIQKKMSLGTSTSTGSSSKGGNQGSQTGSTASDSHTQANLKALAEKQAAIRKLTLGVVLVFLESLFIVAHKISEVIGAGQPIFIQLVTFDVWGRSIPVTLMAITLAVVFWPWKTPAALCCVFIAKPVVFDDDTSASSSQSASSVASNKQQEELVETKHEVQPTQVSGTSSEPGADASAQV